MKMRTADYIADLLKEHHIAQIFSVVGGAAMHLNDAFGRNENLKCLYNHHEQASAIAAEAYARVTNQIAAVCVTAGPGAVNALTGVLCGYMGSIPMLVFSGQVRRGVMARSTGLKLRTLGEQEFDICSAVRSMTKYCETVMDPKKIRYCVEKALYYAKKGRPGPVWLDIPLDVHAAMIEPSELEGYDPEQDNGVVLPPKVERDVPLKIIEKIRNAKRPVFYAGVGVRLSGAYDLFLELADRLNIPVVTGIGTIDMLPNAHPLYAGRTGITGGRAGNFAVQSSDLLLSIGSRLSLKQTGFQHETWARNAYKIISDIAAEELKKETVHADMAIWADAKELIEKLLLELKEPLPAKESWIRQCKKWLERYPAVSEKQRKAEGLVNPYAFYDKLSHHLRCGDIIVLSAGTSRVAATQALEVKEGQRVIVNAATAAMGYCLPAAVGSSIGNQKERIICITGEGGIQMNLQELQTILHNRLPIKIFVVNNQGYQAIRQTQSNFFGKPLFGVGPDSGDISFPDMEKLADAYGYPYFRCNDNQKIDDTVAAVLEDERTAICEMCVTTEQGIEPKVTAKKLKDGTMLSASFENMAPFLSEEELKENLKDLYGKEDIL